jgi:hypothetical protein
VQHTLHCVWGREKEEEGKRGRLGTHIILRMMRFVAWRVEKGKVQHTRYGRTTQKERKTILLSWTEKEEESVIYTRRNRGKI